MHTKLWSENLRGRLSTRMDQWEIGNEKEDWIHHAQNRFHKRLCVARAVGSLRYTKGLNSVQIVGQTSYPYQILVILLRQPRRVNSTGTFKKKPQQVPSTFLSVHHSQSSTAT